MQDLGDARDFVDHRLQHSMRRKTSNVLFLIEQS